jgi:formate dehydrogenase beta subunit
LIQATEAGFSNVETVWGAFVPSGFFIVLISLCLGIGATCGIILSVASKVFYVYEDPRIAEVEYFMAGANVAVAVMPAAAAAVAVVEGKAGPGVCVSADAEAAVNIANVMGVDPGTAEPLKSLNPCRAATAPRISTSTTAP